MGRRLGGCVEIAVDGGGVVVVDVFEVAEEVVGAVEKAGGLLFFVGAAACLGAEGVAEDEGEDARFLVCDGLAGEIEEGQVAEFGEIAG